MKSHQLLTDKISQFRYSLFWTIFFYRGPRPDSETQNFPFNSHPGIGSVKILFRVYILGFSYSPSKIFETKNLPIPFQKKT